MASPIPFISVVIPTYGREAVLCNTIQNVLEQTYPAFELIIVDQTSSHEPATTDFLTSLAANPQVSLYTVAWASLPAARTTRWSAPMEILFCSLMTMWSCPRDFWRPMPTIPDPAGGWRGGGPGV